MSRPFFKKLATSILVTTLTITSGAGRADDTEIYFGSVASDPTTVRPNVLLIIDTSVSMAVSSVDIDPGPGVTNKTRLNIMKDAMTNVINNVEDVNMGLMRFTYSKGGAVLYPIRPIDELVDEPVLNYTVTTGGDDAEEDLKTGAVTLLDPVLDVIQSVAYTSPLRRQVNATQNDADDFFGSVNTLATRFFMDPPGGNTHDAARFTGIDIPPGATIDSANLDLWAADFGAGGQATLSGDDVSNSNAFSDCAGCAEIVTRAKTAASVVWAGIGNNADDTVPETSPDIGSIINEIINTNGGWSAGNALSIISHSTTASRQFYSYDGDPTRAPRLSVNFSNARNPGDQLIALRFQNINIPQGTTITSATLALTSTDGQTTPLNWEFSAEASDNSAALTGAANNLSSRAKTSAVTLAVPDGVTDETMEFEIGAPIQDVVNRTGWCGSNALTVFVKPTQGTSGLRHFHSYESISSGYAATLQIHFDPNTATGCSKATETAQIATSSDDAEQPSSTTTVTLNSSDLDVAERYVGLRFQGIDIPKGAEILDAFIDFTVSTASTAGAPVVAINGHKTDDAGSFTTSSNNISSTTTRPRTTATVNWDMNATGGTWGTVDAVKTTPDVKTIVQELICRGVTAATTGCPSPTYTGNWASGNDMVFIFSDVGANTRKSYSYDTASVGPVKAPRLRITYIKTGQIFNTATTRDQLISQVSGLGGVDNTPIVESLYEAAHYWRGESLLGGDEREGRTAGRLSHVDSYTGGTVYYPTGCNTDDSNLSSASCANQAINGSPIYISPFDPVLSCQSNFQILLTDGEAYFPAAPGAPGQYINSIQTSYLGGSTCRTTGSTGIGITTQERCGIELAEFMFENDQAPGPSDPTGDQLVNTYTVGFELTGTSGFTGRDMGQIVQYLKDIADVGGGEFFEATGAGAEQAIIDAFEVFLSNVKKDPTSFVAPSLATNSFNRLLSRDEAYFGLFTPALEVRWVGNVKKYRVCIDSSQGCTLGEILDATGGSAIDVASNKFKTTSQSIWSDTGADAGVIDGRETTLGGVGGDSTDYTNRIIYTETATAPAQGTALNTAGRIFSQNTSTIANARWDHADMAAMRTTICPTPSTTAGSDCQARMYWVLGKIMTPPGQIANIDPNATTRWSVNDVLHSSPKVITYGGADLLKPDPSDTDQVTPPNPMVAGTDGKIDTFYDKLVFGTNEGGVRFVNAVTGVEEWTFMPSQVLGNTSALIANAEATHIYGMDLTPVVRLVDNDRDGKIETGTPPMGEPLNGNDRVYVYSGMRSGGTGYYALDVSATLTSTSDTLVPKFQWRINGGTAPFDRLAQTWSEPRLATIATASGNKEVLIFGGGYDPALENGFGTTPTGGSDNMGNAIYIVDANTGAKIMSISGSCSGCSDIEVPLMHFSIASAVTILDSDGNGLHDRLYVGDTGGRVWRVDLAADIGTVGDPEGSSVVGRLARISPPPTGTTADNRSFFEAPSVVQVLDTLYSNAAGGEYDYVLMGTGNRSHPLNLTVKDRFYGFRDKTIGTMADADTDNQADAYPKSDGTPIGHGVADELIDVTTADLSSTNTTHDAALGWYYDFNSSGTNSEKVLSTPVTIGGAIFFTTYVPTGTGAADPCVPNIGGGFAYNLNILSAKATLDWDGDNDVDSADKKKALGGGIPSSVVPIFTKEGVVGIVGVEGGAAQLGTLSGLPRFRTYWYEED